MQPGQTINPNGTDEKNQPPAELPAVETQKPTEPTEVNAAAVPNPEPPAPAPEPPKTFTTEPRAEWAPGPVEDTVPEQQLPADVQWTASEFIEHQKPAMWHAVVVAGGVILSGVLYLITKDVVSVIAVVIASILFSIIGSRKPRTLSYAISRAGVKVADKVYPFSDIKSFTVIKDGAIQSIQLLPLKRFMPPLTIYYPPEQEQSIIDNLADYIPNEQRRSDPVDRLMKRIRF